MFKTFRLAARPVELCDGINLARLLRDPDIQDLTGILPPPFSGAAELIDQSIRLRSDPSNRTFQVHLQLNAPPGYYLGHGTIIPGVYGLELGVATQNNPNLRSKGYGTEAMGGLVSHVFNTMNDVDFVFARTRPENLKSQRMLAANGFVFEGTVPSALKWRNRAPDYLFKLTRKSWEIRIPNFFPPLPTHTTETTPQTPHPVPMAA